MSNKKKTKNKNKKSTTVVIKFKKKKAEACKRHIKSDNPKRKILPSILKPQSKYLKKSCPG